MELYIDKLFTIIKQKKFKQKINNKSIFFLKGNHSINNLHKNKYKKTNKSNPKEKIDTLLIKEKENFECIILNKSNISLIKHSLLTPFLKECLNNIQYLSLKYNHIRSLHFLKHLPNLYYLDISDNPLDDIDTLNYKNIFGYLKLSLERYSEKKILNINGLYCGIFELQLNDESLLTLFRNNNPFICLFNNKVNYFYDKVLSDEEKLSKSKRRYSFKIYNSLMQKSIINDSKDNEEEEKLEFNEKDKNKEESTDKKILKESNTNINNSKNNKNEENNGDNYNYDNNNKIFRRKNTKRTSSIRLKYTYINCYNYGFKSKHKNSKFKDKNKKGIENLIKSEDLLKIKHYFDEYNDTIINICNNCNTRGRKSKIPVKAKYLKNYKEYLSIERQKLILLNNIYQKLSIFNEDKKENKYITLNKDFINVNPYVDNLEMFKLKNYIKCIYTDPNISIIVLIVLLFYCLGIISNLMMNTIIGHLLVKYYKYIDVINIPKFENENTSFHFLSYYFDNYENIKQKFSYSDIKDNKIIDIMNILEMTKISLRSNALYFNKKKVTNFIINDINKNNFNEEINYLESLEIKDEIIVLLIYLCDFIIYDKLEQALINGGYPNEYSYLIRFKEIIKEKELKLKDKEIALSERKYQKNQIERLHNKFYFKLYKIEEIKNSKFNIKKNIIKKLKNKNDKYDKEEEYDSGEDIEDINKYFVIQNKNLDFKNVNSNRMFKNIQIINSIQSYSPNTITINNFNNYKNNYSNFKKNNSNQNEKINISDSSNKIYSYHNQENKISINNEIIKDKKIKFKDKNKLILKTFNNLSLKSIKNTIQNYKTITKFPLKDNNTKLDDKLLYGSNNNYMFKTFANDSSIKSIIKRKLNEKDFSIKAYYTNRKQRKLNHINNMDYLYDLIDEQNKKLTIRNTDKFNSLRNAERIYYKKKNDFLLLYNKEINSPYKGIYNKDYLKSRNKKIKYNNIPSLNIKKYNQKEMERILLNYKNKKYGKYNKTES